MDKAAYICPFCSAQRQDQKTIQSGHSFYTTKTIYECGTFLKIYHVRQRYKGEWTKLCKPKKLSDYPIQPDEFPPGE